MFAHLKAARHTGSSQVCAHLLPWHDRAAIALTRCFPLEYFARQRKKAGLCAAPRQVSKASLDQLLQSYTTAIPAHERSRSAVVRPFKSMCRFPVQLTLGVLSPAESPELRFESRDQPKKAPTRGDAVCLWWHRVDRLSTRIPRPPSSAGRCERAPAYPRPRAGPRCTGA